MPFNFVLSRCFKIVTISDKTGAQIGKLLFAFDKDMIYLMTCSALTMFRLTRTCRYRFLR
jgi:hypothetical protein